MLCIYPLVSWSLSRISSCFSEDIVSCNSLKLERHCCIFVESQSPNRLFAPGWHFCSICTKAANFQCYTCPTAYCSGCLDQAEFHSVRHRKGLCEECWPIVQMIENKETVSVDEGVCRQWQPMLTRKHGLQVFSLVGFCNAGWESPSVDG